MKIIAEIEDPFGRKKIKWYLDDASQVYCRNSDVGNHLLWAFDLNVVSSLVKGFEPFKKFLTIV